MQKSGIAGLLAAWLQQAIGAWPERAIPLVLFTVVAVITQFMSNAATIALFLPAALAMAPGFEPPARTVRRNCSHGFSGRFSAADWPSRQPSCLWSGRYQFLDFVKVGTPLTAVSAAIVVWLAR